LKKYLDFKNIFLADTVQSLIEQKPDIAGISSNSFNFKEAIRISEEIKKSLAIPVIIGGPHISILPYSLPDTADIGVTGEGEETMKELLEIYMRDGAFHQAKLSSVKGIVYREGDIKKITSQREAIKPLDKIPVPDRSLAGETDWTPCIITSRGCAYKCKFCSLSSCVQTFRSFSVKHIKEELFEIINRIESYPHVRILDDVFALNIKKLEAIKNFILEHSFQKKVTFDCSVRADLFNEEICKILKDMNVTRILLGAESGTDRILKYYRKGQTAEDNQRVLDLCNDYGIEVTASFIIGAPPETEDDLKETYNFIRKNRGNFWNVHVHPLDPLPGTEIWNYAKKRGFVTDYDEEIKSVNLSEHLSDDLFREYLKSFLELICFDVEKHFTVAQKLMEDFYSRDA